jgi:hypothetical protein
MKNLIKISGLTGALLSLIFLAACSSTQTNSTPTVDLVYFRTEVAATVLAQVGQTLAAAPTITPIPTSTPTPTLTSTSTPAPPVILSPEAPGAPPAGTLPVLTLPAGATPITPPATGGINLAQWVSQSIADDTIIAPGKTFTITWQLKNIGTSTWTANYLLRFYSGDNFGYPKKEIPLGRTVAPGETLDMSLKMTAPTTPGNYRTDWVLSDENRSNFKQPVFLKIVVASKTTTPTLAATATP